MKIAAALTVASLLTTSLLASGLFASGAAEAQMFKGGPQTMLPQNHDACSVDAHTYCSGVSQVRGSMRECLAIHQSQLSPACRKSMTQMRNWNQFHPAAHR
jgi:hypothetical protein